MRQWVNSNRTCPSTNSLTDVCLGIGDLRLKLMQKSTLGKLQNNNLKKNAEFWDRLSNRIVHSSTSGVLSPERDVKELQRRSIFRAFDDGKSNPYMRNDNHSSTRSVSSASFLAKSVVPAAPAKPVAPVVSQFPQASPIARRVPYRGDVLPTVESLLKSLGLEKYIVSFKHEEVDMRALSQMGDGDLKELGIPKGLRKKILQALSARRRLDLDKLQLAS
ncbi:hypothetical protein Nepgr_017197 [Nepenthes gracilis]|uniref:SAM domain-containing protein n=1 Tax=Nepenthes gracilis TaxID=150966 RepID=A0AAD3SRK9_NEPGR|nr:hypothetical protein Nepgr_017197 [Nepenthes gracilis]